MKHHQDNLLRVGNAAWVWASFDKNCRSFIISLYLCQSGWFLATLSHENLTNTYETYLVDFVDSASTNDMYINFERRRI